MDRRSDNFEAALEAHERGIACIPIVAGTKVPAVPWKRWQTELPPVPLLDAWFKDTRTNLAIVTSGMVVFDAETAAAADRVLAICGETPHKLKTPHGGIHLGYGHTTTFLSALKIVRFVRSLGGDEAAMWELLRYYNATKCDPAWREAPELAHKLEEALKKA